MKQLLKYLALAVFFGMSAFLFIPSSGETRAISPETENLEPEISDLRYKKVGVGQRLTFGLEVIDEEADFIRVELVKKPASAKYNENTLTVDWTATKADMLEANFLVRVTEIPRDKARKLMVFLSQCFEPNDGQIYHSVDEKGDF